MPHVSIKAIQGATEAQKKSLSEKIAALVEQELGKPMKYISVSFEDYEFGGWEGVYNAEIRGNANLYVKPEYTNPVDFS